MKNNNLSIKLEKFFWYFLFINPFLDILNGVFLNAVMRIGNLDVETAGPSVTPSLLVRMFILLIFALYLIIAWDKKAILTAIPLGITFLLSVVSEYFFKGQIALFADLQYMARFCYNILLLLVYSRVFRNMYTTKEELLERINRLISVTLVILTLSIVISFIFELGYNTYSDRMGTRGSRGFFYAGNDITAILVLLMPLSMAAFINSGWRDAGKLKKLLAVAPSVLAANSLAIIGSKTAFLGVGITFGAILLFAVIKLILNKDNTVLLGILFILVSSAIFFVVVMLISSGSLLSSVLNSLFATGFIVEEEGLEAAMFSGRQIKLKDQFGQFKDAGMLVWLFGMGRGSQEVIIEMDIFEVLFYYGLLGFFTMLWLYLRLGLALLAGVFKKFSLTGFCILISLVLCTGYLVAAGHILFSVTSGFYFSFTILYSRVYLSDKPQDVLLFRY